MKFLSILIFIVFAAFKLNAQEPECVGKAGVVEWFIYDDVEGRVDRNSSYPQSPDGIEQLRSLETEEEFNDRYASIIRGFLKVPETGTYFLNITGRDYAEFYISRDEFPENKKLLLETSWSGYSDFYKDPNQTDTLVLIAGKYYFFEIHHRENTGGEHLRVSWQTPFGNGEWQTIGEDFIYSYTCNEMCPPKGTPCDDGNSTTINDRHDGACNCFGIPAELPDCIGDYGQLLALYYDNIEGNDVNSLLNHPSYPLQPSRADYLEQIRLPNQSKSDNFGSTIKAFLKVPVSGTYEFSAVGNTRSEIYFSLTGDLTDVALIANSSGMTSILELESEKFYYIKLIHKEAKNSEEFAALWKTPFYTDSVWKYIDGAYLFQYKCELACMPQGTICDDGDPETINDTFDENCQCSGVYCPDGNCPESKSFAHYEVCASTNQHGNHPDDSWLSCVASESMNAERGLAHWIQYDLGSVMPIGKSHVWNYNVSDNTGAGFKNVAIDLSIDGKNWEEFNTFEWPEATGENDYQGFDGPDFSGESARYILLTGLNNWKNDLCGGFSEIRFDVATCPAVGTPCNDNDASTVNDSYNQDCMCEGILISDLQMEIVNNHFKMYPNPAKEWTTLVFYLSESSSVDLSLYDITGRLVYHIATRQSYSAGMHQKILALQNMVNGQYILHLKTDSGIFTQKLIVSE